jgi:hypothetical protein
MRRLRQQIRMHALSIFKESIRRTGERDCMRGS